MRLFNDFIDVFSLIHGWERETQRQDRERDSYMFELCYHDLSFLWCGEMSNIWVSKIFLLKIHFNFQKVNFGTLVIWESYRNCLQ